MYRMAKINCHINQCDTSMQYFAILESVRETHNIKITFTLTFILKNKRRSTMRQSLRQNTFVVRHIPIVARQNHCIVRQKNLAIR